MTDTPTTGLVRQPALKRDLGSLEATTLVVGGIIGISIFIVPADVARLVGAPGLMLVTWALSGFLATCGALCLAELSAAIPVTGGTYAFLKRAYRGTPIAFLFGWMMCFAYATGAIAVVASMAAIYAGQFLGRVLPYGTVTIRIVAVLIILVLTTINYLGVRQAGKTQNVLTFIKVGLIVAVVFIALFAGSGSIERFAPLVPSATSAPSVLASVGTAMVLSVFSFSGAYFVTHVAGEVREPGRTIPRAIVIGMAVVFVLYLAINAVYIYVLPFDQLRASERVAADTMQAVLGPIGADVTALVVMLSAIGALNAQMLNYPRIVFALATDGLFFRQVSRVHRLRHTPAAAILLVGLWSCVLAVAGTYQQILTAVGFVAQLLLSLAVAAVIVLRFKEPDLARPYRVPGYPVTPVLFLAISAWYLINLLSTRLGPSLVGIGIVLLGLPFYYYWTRTAEVEDDG